MSSGIITAVNKRQTMKEMKQRNRKLLQIYSDFRLFNVQTFCCFVSDAKIANF